MKYIILADSVTGFGRNVFHKGEHVPAFRIPNIAQLIENKSIEEVPNAAIDVPVTEMIAVHEVPKSTPKKKGNDA